MLMKTILDGEANDPDARDARRSALGRDSEGERSSAGEVKLGLGEAAVVAGLGFGCAALMGRVGRKESLAALGAAYEAGIRFFDSARSYGYGEAEALLGEFLRGRRSGVVISTKFGVLPAAAGPMSAARRLKPLVRGLLHVAPGARRWLQGPLAAQRSSGHFSVADLHASLEASLRALRTDYVDVLSLHDPPPSVLERGELFAALQDLVAAGKVRWVGVAAEPEVIESALAARPAGLRYLQFPCNLFNLGLGQRLVGRAGGDFIAIANHPFGGPAGVAGGKRLLSLLSVAPATPAGLREKLRPADDAVLADVVLNLVTGGLGVPTVVASMLHMEHLRANLAALRNSRFDSKELSWILEAILSTEAAAMTPGS
jgi:aryl-alcohol dehydrogenase-like predicted oxidoreductase